MNLKKSFSILFCLAIIAAMSVLVSCEDDPCPTDGKCYVGSDGFSVSNMCGKSKCAVSRQGAKNVSCDCP